MVRLAKLVASLDVDKLLFKIYKNKRTQAFIIGLNTREQLFINREDSKGRKLAEIGGGYSPVTEEINEGAVFEYQGETNVKTAGASPFLFDEGVFFGSFTVAPSEGGFTLDADPVRDGTNLFTDGSKRLGAMNQRSRNSFSLKPRRWPRSSR